MALPVIRFWEFDNSAEAPTKTFAACDAGAYEPAAHPWWKIKVWNDKGGTEGSIKATSVRLTVRDSDGGTDELWVKQGWIEIKSDGVQGAADATITSAADIDIGTDEITVNLDIPTGEEIRFTTDNTLPPPLVAGTTYYAIRVNATTIMVATTLANAEAGTQIDITGVGAGTQTVTIYLVDDAMANFKAIGLNMPLTIGDIPKGCNRTLYVRCHPPTDAIENAGITFVIRALFQEPSVPICKYITDLHGNGIWYQSTGAFKVTDGAGADSLVDVERGIALINSAEVYHGASQSHEIAVADDVYKLYLTSTGVIASTTGAIPSGSIELAWVTIAGAVVTYVIDRRNFLMQRVCSQHFQDLKIAAVDGIHAAIAGTGAEQEITAGITNPDYARNPSFTMTNIAAPGGVVKIKGIVQGKYDEEDVTLIPNNIAYCNKAFDTVTMIVIPAGVTAADTVTVGFSDKIGLSNKIAVAADVFKKKVNNIDEIHEIAGNVDTTYHTLDCDTIVLNEDMEIRYRSILTI